MYDFVRWTLLFLIFAGLIGFYAWNWYRNYGKAILTGQPVETGFKLVHKKSIDYRTGICLVEANGQNYLLAYTAEGGVSWQPLGPKVATVNEAAPVAQPSNLRLIP
jgi:hypothetical protein